MINDNEFEEKENEIYTKDKIEPQHIQKRTKRFFKSKLCQLRTPC